MVLLVPLVGLFYRPVVCLRSVQLASHSTLRLVHLILRRRAPPPTPAITGRPWRHSRAQISSTDSRQPLGPGRRPGSFPSRSRLHVPQDSVATTRWQPQRDWFRRRPPPDRGPSTRPPLLHRRRHHLRPIKDHTALLPARSRPL